MALSKIYGQMLTDNLLRDGNNLAFDTDLLLLDVVNDRIGVNKPNPTEALDIVGNLTLTGNISGNDISINNLILSGTNISSNSALNVTSGTDSDITITANGDGMVVIPGDDGIVIPGGTTAQRPNTPPTNTLRFNSDTNLVEVYNGSIWKNVGTEYVNFTTQVINGDGITTTFTLDKSTTENSILVNINGVMQEPSSGYTVLGDQISFPEAPSVSDRIVIRFMTETMNINFNSPSSISSGNNEINTTNDISITVNSTNLLNFSTDNIVDASNAHSIQLPVYTVTEANTLLNKSVGQVIYVSNGSSGTPCLAVYDGSGWKKIALFAGNISE